MLARGMEKGAWRKGTGKKEKIFQIKRAVSQPQVANGK